MIKRKGGGRRLLASLAGWEDNSPRKERRNVVVVANEITGLALHHDIAPLTIDGIENRATWATFSTPLPNTFSLLNGGIYSLFTPPPHIYTPRATYTEALLSLLPLLLPFLGQSLNCAECFECGSRKSLRALPTRASVAFRWLALSMPANSAECCLLSIGYPFDLLRNDLPFFFVRLSNFFEAVQTKLFLRIIIAFNLGGCNTRVEDKNCEERNRVTRSSLLLSLSRFLKLIRDEGREGGREGDK